MEEGEKNRLLKKYWEIPDRQVETSVVLVDGRFMASGDCLHGINPIAGLPPSFRYALESYAESVR